MKQKDALNILKAGKNVYITGAAGSGKTYALNEYISYLKQRGVSVAVTASTGIAATHIGGTTIHSWSGIGIRDYFNDSDIENLVQKEHLYKRFERARVLVIDEVSMLSAQLLDFVERICRAMKRSTEPFGGMQIVLSGDFFQLPPISGDAGNGGAEFINSSDAWKKMDVRVCYLDEQFRHSDSSLERILNEMRGSKVSQETRALLEEMLKKEQMGKVAITPTRLYSHNADVDAENQRELDKLPGNGRVYEMTSRGKKSIVESFKKSILAPEKLTLKKKALVMFVKNAFDNGYVNGTLGIVEDFDGAGMPVVRTFSGKKIFVGPAEWTVEEDGKIRAKVEQLPLRLAWAITVHKSQGMSLDAAEIDLSKAFVPGQGYVALSRLRRLNGLSLRGLNDMALKMHPQALKIDAYLLSESAKWEKVLTRFDDSEMGEMHKNFLHKIGGTTDEKEIAKNKEKRVEPKERVSTFEKTRVLVAEGFSISEIAKTRGVTERTIISHLEELKATDPTLDLRLYKPKEKVFEIISDAFKKATSTQSRSSDQNIGEERKLTPVFNILNGKYSFEELRLVRLFL